MAILSKFIIGSCLLSSIASAAPFDQHRYSSTASSTPTTTTMTTAPATTTTVNVAEVSSTTVAVSSSLSTAAPASTSTAASTATVSASTSGTCEGEGNACVGDVTYWTGGLGACGYNVDTSNDLAIALPYEFMGTLSNTNPYCNRTVTLLNPTSGTTVQAIVSDKCMGCIDRAIDCTEKLFNAITDGTGDGRVSGIEWWLD